MNISFRYDNFYVNWDVRLDDELVQHFVSLIYLERTNNLGENWWKLKKQLNPRLFSSCSLVLILQSVKNTKNILTHVRILIRLSKKCLRPRRDGRIPNYPSKKGWGSIKKKRFTKLSIYSYFELEMKQI